MPDTCEIHSLNLNVQRSTLTMPTAMFFAIALGQFLPAVMADERIPMALATTEPSTSCQDLRECRTVWNIIWSCLATLFACTWIAMHPNIPGPYEARSRLVLRRIGLMVLGLLVPELVIMWAMRQWFGARKLARKYRSSQSIYTSLH